MTRTGPSPRAQARHLPATRTASALKTRAAFYAVAMSASSPAERRQLARHLPPVQPADASVIERFLDRFWAEQGVARQTLESYRRDLEGLARWRDGAGGGLLGIDRAALFDYLRWRTRAGILRAARRGCCRPCVRSTDCACAMARAATTPPP